jgi:murein DD-endopeptidase MepM/ murein hydrolase activator NlpD
MLSACGTQQPAVYNYYGVERGAGSAGIHTVLQGDTLYSISRNYQIPMREIILLNKLKPPYVMNAGYRMKLPPPNEYIVRAGDSIQSVAQLYEVSPNRLANLNGLRAPYYLPPGQVLRLPTPSGKNSSAKRYTATSTINKNSSSPRSVERQALKTPRTGTPRTGTPNLGSIVSSTAAPPKVAVPTSKPVVKKTALNKPELKKPQVKTKTVSRAKTPSIPKLADGNFMRPVDGKIISSYGAKKDGLHNDGINIKAVKGTPVRAAQNGVVVYNGDDLDGYGNLVLIRHENKMMTAYAHLDKTLVKRGEKVARGQSIGTVGKTGQVDTPQLHFEVRKGSTPLNPDKYL